MGKSRWKKVKAKRAFQKHKVLRYDQRMINTGHNWFGAQPTTSEAMPSRDAMAVLWQGEFKQGIERFSRKCVYTYPNFNRIWLVYRGETFILMMDDYVARVRRFSIFYGTEARAFQGMRSPIWREVIPMDDTRITHDREVQSPKLWRRSPYPSVEQLSHD